MSPFAKCCLLSGGCFHGLSESWRCSTIHLLCAHTDWAAIQLTKQYPRQGIATYQCDLPDSDGFFIATSVICTRGFCPVLGPFLSGRVLGVSAELSWGQFIPPVVVFWCPSFPWSPWTKVIAAWTLLREAAHPFIHWCRSCRALLYQIRSDFVCAQVRCQEISCRYPTWSLFLLQVVSGRQGNKNVQQGLANSVSSQAGDCRNPSPHLVQCLWTRISPMSMFTLRITES